MRQKIEWHCNHAKVTHSVCKFSRKFMIVRRIVIYIYIYMCMYIVLY